MQRRPNADTPPGDTATWAALLARVSAAYTDGDNERYTLERALAVSSREMRELYEARARSEARQAALREVATCVAGGNDPTHVADMAMSTMRALMPGSETGVRWITGEVGVSPGEVAEVTTANVKRLFRLA